MNVDDIKNPGNTIILLTTSTDLLGTFSKFYHCAISNYRIISNYLTQKTFNKFIQHNKDTESKISDCAVKLV